MGLAKGAEREREVDQRRGVLGRLAHPHLADHAVVQEVLDRRDARREEAPRERLINS